MLDTTGGKTTIHKHGGTNMKQKTKSVAALAATCLLAVSLTGCGDTGNSQQETPQSKPAQQEAPQSEPAQQEQEAKSQASETEDKDTLESNISVTNVSMSEVKVYSTSVDDYDPERGYLIQATVTNDNDTSCDITPYFAVDITGTDDYGAEQTQRVVIYGSAVFTPYGLKSAQKMQSVGLAPHETKNVRYYVYLDGSTPLLASPLTDETDDENEYYATGPFDSIYSDKITSLSNIELVSFNAEESDMVYVSASEWGQSVTLNKEYDDGSSWGGYSTYNSVISGSVTNSTQDRWLSATAQFDVNLSGQALNSNGIWRTYATLDHVDIGASAELSEKSIITTQNDYDVTLTPALLAYEPDMR